MIDFHTHTFPDRIAAAAIGKLEQAAHAHSFSDGTQSGLVRSMQAAGVDHAVVLPVATNPLKCASMNDTSHALDGLDGLTYFAAIHPDAPDWHEELGRVKALGFKGIKIFVCASTKSFLYKLDSYFILIAVFSIHLHSR